MVTLQQPDETGINTKESRGLVHYQVQDLVSVVGSGYPFGDFL
jgi:hypothetical protein